MFGSIFGVYRLLIASTMALYGHGRGVVQVVKSAKIFSPIFVPSADSYVDILQERLHSCLFFLPNSNPELKKMLSMMVSPPMPLAPHKSRV